VLVAVLDGVAVGKAVAVCVGLAVAVDVAVEDGVGVGTAVGITTVILGALGTVVVPASPGAGAGRTLIEYSPGSSTSSRLLHTPLLPTVTV
jgi:hypothetical protein